MGLLDADKQDLASCSSGKTRSSQAIIVFTAQTND